MSNPLFKVLEVVRSTVNTKLNSYTPFDAIVLTLVTVTTASLLQSFMERAKRVGTYRLQRSASHRIGLDRIDTVLYPSAPAASNRLLTDVVVVVVVVVVCWQVW